MDITIYLKEYTRKKKFPSLLYDAKAVRNLLDSDSKWSLSQQDGYKDSKYIDSDYLADNIRESVKRKVKDKDQAILIYKDFLQFLKPKGIIVDIKFPPINVSNDFERLMFIAKYQQDPDHKITDLPDLLWVGSRTIEDDISKLRGTSDGKIQICGKVFQIPDIERKKGTLKFVSTAHPLFLTPNIPQILATLKGLKSLSNDPLYENFARTFAADIWEQLSDYAKDRIHTVFSEILPEDLSWYESLQKEEDDEDEDGGDWFYTEQRCSIRGNIHMDVIKNDKISHVIYQTDNGQCVYANCKFIWGTYDGVSYEVNCSQGRVRLYFNKIIRSAYTPEELV